jgi:hypothetical protein
MIIVSELDKAFSPTNVIPPVPPEMENKFFDSKQKSNKNRLVMYFVCTDSLFS